MRVERRDTIFVHPHGQDFCAPAEDAGRVAPDDTATIPVTRVGTRVFRA